MIKYLTELIKNKISTIISISFGIFVWVIINRIPQVVNAYSIGILDGTYEFREFPLAVFKFGIQVSPLVFTFVYILSYIINKLTDRFNTPQIFFLITFIWFIFLTINYSNRTYKALTYNESRINEAKKLVLWTKLNQDSIYKKSFNEFETEFSNENGIQRLFVGFTAINSTVSSNDSAEITRRYNLDSYQRFRRSTGIPYSH